MFLCGFSSTTPNPAAGRILQIFLTSLSGSPLGWAYDEYRSPLLLWGRHQCLQFLSFWGGSKRDAAPSEDCECLVSKGHLVFHYEPLSWEPLWTIICALTLSCLLAVARKIKTRSLLHEFCSKPTQPPLGWQNPSFSFSNHYQLTIHCQLKPLSLHKNHNTT